METQESGSNRIKVTYKQAVAIQAFISNYEELAPLLEIPTKDITKALAVGTIIEAEEMECSAD